MCTYWSNDGQRSYVNLHMNERVFMYNFFSLNWLSFSPSLFFCAWKKGKETFRTFLSSKKLKINNWVVLAVQRQIISQMLVLRIIFQESISYSYCIAPRKKLLFWLLLLISMRHDLNENWKKGCIPKLECLGNVKLQSAASKRYSYSLSMHHPSNINWTILSTVRLIETLEEIYCTFKHKGQSWLQIIEVKLKKQR